MALNLIDFSNIQEFENLYGSQVFSNSENGADFLFATLCNFIAMDNALGCKYYQTLKFRGKSCSNVFR